MNRTTLIAGVLLIAAIGAGAAYYLAHTAREARPPAGAATSTPNLVGQNIFTDGEDGFSIVYPASYQVDETFASFYHLPAYWRANALPDGTGTPVVALIGYRTQSDHSYPRYFDAEVRIGVSSDPKEVARCLTAATDQAEKPLPDANLNGTLFKAFSFESAGMMQYVKGVSYRAVHEGKCVAVEQLETGASYRDDPPSAADIPDSTLEQKYAALDAVVRTFSFARP